MLKHLFSILILTFFCISCQEEPSNIKKVYYKNVKLKTHLGITTYNNTPFSGTWFSTYANSNDTFQIRNYVNGKEHGSWKVFHQNHQLSEVRHYKKGGKEGEYKAWWENGNPKLTYSFMNDENHGEFTEWTKDGKIISKMNYVNGHESGQQKVWYLNGKLKSNYVMKNGRRFGLLGTKNCMNVYN